MISNNNFIITEIPNFHPLSLERKLWWREEKRRIFEGCWSSGKWMPGPLYMYVNFWTILLNKGLNSKAKVMGRPILRDIDWEKAYMYMEARGFSGFSDDKKYSCNEAYNPSRREDSISLGLFSAEDKTIYIPAREYLKKNHGTDLGKPLFENMAKNIIDIEARGGGKSYFGSCCIAHNFITDGATDYEAYLEAKKIKKGFSSETLVGAIDAKYSKDLLSKFKLGFDELPGGIEHNGEFYPSPLVPSVQGSLEPSRFLEAVRDTKKGDNWVKEGSRSKIHHRSFMDNPFAGNGTRPGVTFLEEIGFMGNLIDSLGALKESTADGANKFGTIWMFGTGGDMAGGSTFEAQNVFFDPVAYDCLAFDDIYENRVGKIGYFLPATMTLNQFKNSEGITNIAAADKFLQIEREKAKASKRSENLNNELQNRPLLPSEAFLVTGNNTFPVAELKETLSMVEGNPEKYINSNWVGVLKYVEEIDKYMLEPRDDIHPIREFPLKKGSQGIQGAIELFEKPQEGFEGIQRGIYIAGIDPVDDDYSSGDSLASIVIFNRLTRRVVAEYTARPDSANEFFETCRKMLIYYNATALYESDKKGLFTYFETRKCTYLLADTPENLRDREVWKEGTNKSKGLNGTTRVNNFGRSLIKTWLKEAQPNNNEVLNLSRIRSVGLLKELITWNPDANFDRVSALGMCMIYDMTLQVDVVKEGRKKAESFLNSNYFRQLGMTRELQQTSYDVPNYEH